MKRKRDIDAALAGVLGLSKRDVSDVTKSFLELVAASLVDGHEVRLEGFGKLRLVVEKAQEGTTQLTDSKGKKQVRLLRVHRKFRVHFSKAEPFDRMLRKKYGPSSEKKS